MIEPKATLNEPQTATKAGSNEREFVFGGIHLLASYVNCRRERLLDYEGIERAMTGAIAASGAAVMDRSTHVFEGGGMTCVYVLAESHASIHTYPEHSSCFVDIFTCGYDCVPSRFDEAMRAYLEPEKVNCRIVDRGDNSGITEE
ncbi:MAG: adenosylmethionine decarboxylase [Candidatus Melainabacteria bacterium]|nr:adenosylmethionine decarboxylase [Candidatus Melainabacteria bacterium]